MSQIYIGKDKLGRAFIGGQEYTKIYLGPNLIWTSHTHNYVLTKSVASTCTTRGYNTYTCECGDSYKVYQPLLSHKYTNGYCTYCGQRNPSYYTYLIVLEDDSSSTNYGYSYCDINGTITLSNGDTIEINSSMTDVGANHELGGSYIGGGYPQSFNGYINYDYWYPSSEEPPYDGRTYIDDTFNDYGDGAYEIHVTAED